MARSDFNWVPIGHKFTNGAPTVIKDFPIEGNQQPIDDAFLLIQVRGVSVGTHRIQINGTQLAGFDLPPAPGSSQAWLTWMDHIPPNLLKSGLNTIRIDRVGNDDFEINAVVVNWRE